MESENKNTNSETLVLNQQSSEKSLAQKNQQKAQNTDAILNLVINIILPSILLDKLSKNFGENGPLIALLVGISLPISYAIWEWVKFKRRSFVSLLGFLNVLFTGGFALLHLEGKWFAWKEAIFPSLIGVFVYFSVYMKKPFIEHVFYNPNLFDLEKLESALKANQTEKEFRLHLLKATKFLSFSFFLSAILNYALATYIFQPISTNLSQLEQATLLNEQISRMNWMSFVVIMLPSMICLMLILRYLLQGINKYAGLKFQEVMKNQ